MVRINKSFFFAHESTAHPVLPVSTDLAEPTEASVVSWQSGWERTYLGRHLYSLSMLH